MVIDHEYNLQILDALSDVYPARMSAHEIQPHTDRLAHMSYLLEHGFIDAEEIRTTKGYALGPCKITASGLDFLKEGQEGPKFVTYLDTDE